METNGSVSRWGRREREKKKRERASEEECENSNTAQFKIYLLICECLTMMIGPAELRVSVALS